MSADELMFQWQRYGFAIPFTRMDIDQEWDRTDIVPEYEVDDGFSDEEDLFFD
jgi:hypothetical protein